MAIDFHGRKERQAFPCSSACISFIVLLVLMCHDIMSEHTNVYMNSMLRAHDQCRRLAGRFTCRYPVIEKRDPGILHAHRLAGSLQSINSFKARPICHKPGVTVAGRIAFDSAPGISTVSGEPFWSSNGQHLTLITATLFRGGTRGVPGRKAV